VLIDYVRVRAGAGHPIACRQAAAGTTAVPGRRCRHCPPLLPCQGAPPPSLCFQVAVQAPSLGPPETNMTSWIRDSASALHIQDLGTVGLSLFMSPLKES
jgi:hypothetical protein